MGTVEVFLRKVGIDARQIANEIEKLSLYLGPRREVTVADLDAIVASTRVSAMWDLLDAVGERNSAEGLNALRDLLSQKESPIGIVMSIAGRIRELALYREALDQGWVRLRQIQKDRYSAEWGSVPPAVDSFFAGDMKRDPRSLHQFFVSKMVGQAARHSARSLRANQRMVLATYERLVSTSVSPATLLDIMLTRLTSSARVDSGRDSAKV